MRAYACVDGLGALKLDRPIPTPHVGEALVRVLRAGICNTDLELLKGYKGGFTGVLGHEFVGEVTAVGDQVEPSLIGQRVCGELNVSCSKCYICGRGGTLARNHCSNRRVLGIINCDGTYAEYLTLPVCNLHQVPDSITTEAATFVEPLAAACRIVEQGLIQPEARVCVMGDGKLGLLCAEVVARQSLATKPVLVGRHPERAALIGDLVQSRIVDRGAKEAPEDLQGSFDVVIDATGSVEGLRLAASLTMPMGTLVLKTTCAEPASIDTSGFVVREINLVGSRCGPFPDAIKLLEAGDLDVSKYISGVFPLESVEEALEFARSKGCLKVQLAIAESELSAVGKR